MATINPGDLQTQIENLEQRTADQGEQAAVLGAAADGDTRNVIAKEIARFYFGILILIIIGVPVYNYLMVVNRQPVNIISIKDAILTYSAVAGPTFGLVIAYYFKTKN